MEKTVQQKLEEARALMHRAEGALDAAKQSGIDEIIQAAEHAMAQAKEVVVALEDAAALEAEQADAETLEEAVEIAEEEREQAEEAAEELEDLAEDAGDAAAAAAAAEALDAMDDADEALDDAGDIIDDILEEQEEARPRKKKTGLIIGICLAAAALLGGGYYYYTNYYLPTVQTPVVEETVQQAVMPDLTLETADVAEQKLAELGIEADVLFVSSEKVPAGVVTLQSVSAGQPIEEDVVLYVSMGPAPTPTPDRGPLPTPTPSPTPKPVRTKAPVIELPVETPCPTG